MDFNTQMIKDVDDIFLNEFSQVAVFESKSTLKVCEITVQFFESPLDGMEETYFHVWCKYDDICSVRKNDKLTINGIAYGIVDYSPDEFQHAMNLFIQKV